MANELRYSISLAYTRDGDTKEWPRRDNFVSVTGDNDFENVVTTSAAEADLPLGSVTVGGFAVFRNLSSTATEIITIKAGAGNSAWRLLPGEETIKRLVAGVTYRTQAAAGTPRLRYWLLEA